MIKHLLQFLRIILLLTVWVLPLACGQKNPHRLQPKKEILDLADQSLNNAVKQYKYLMDILPEGHLPKSFEEGKLLTSGVHAWTSGFYPGTLLYLYQYSGDSALLREATETLKLLEKLQTVTTTHDLGFMMYCSFGNAYQIQAKEDYRQILVNSAKSLSTRYNPTVGSIKSWNNVKSFDGETVWGFPVIIDNMMNLELLLFAHKATGDTHYKNIAVKHAETTLKNHVRPDFSSYHVVDYDPETGEVKSKETHQGFSDNSTWARGQAWGIYGFTMMYRETRQQEFLETARKMAGFFLNHPNLPKDKIPYWDFNVDEPGYTPQWNYDPSKFAEIPRDASAAAITASALIELAAFDDEENGKRYLKAAEDILASLASPQYFASTGEIGGFILKHSTGGVPSHAEIDVPLTYADYYYVEALLRYKNLNR